MKPTEEKLTFSIFNCIHFWASLEKLKRSHSLCLSNLRGIFFDISSDTVALAPQFTYTYLWHNCLHSDTIWCLVYLSTIFRFCAHHHLLFFLCHTFTMNETNNNKNNSNKKNHSSSAIHNSPSRNRFRMKCVALVTKSPWSTQKKKQNEEFV